MCWTIVLLLILMTLGCLSGEDKTKVTVSCLGHQKAFGSSCYEFVLLQHTFSSAQALCEQRGGHLAFIPDEETQYFFQRHVDPKKDMWFGVAPSAFPILPFSSTVEGPLSWLDDSPIIYSNWVSSPQAGASCGHLLRDSGFQWEATKDCNKKLHFICQFESGRSIVCGGRNTTLQCGSGQVLMLDGGFHGRRSMHYCRSTLSTPTTPTQHQCGWVDVGEALTAHCQGRQVCHITELVKSFGEPCPEIGSYLSVDYHCKEGLALSVSTVSAVYDDVTIMVKWLLDLPRGNLGCKLSANVTYRIHKDKMLLSGLSVVRGTASHNITVTPEKAQQLGPGCHQLTLQASNMVTFPEASADLQMCVLEKVAGLQASVLTEQPDCQDSASITIDVSLERGTPVLLLFSLKGDHSLTCTQGCDPVEDNTDAKIKMACEGKAQCPQVVWHIEDPRKKQDWPKETESCYKHAKTRPLIQTRHSGTEYTVSHSNLKKAEKHDLTVVVTYEEGEYFYKKYIIKTKSSEGGASPSSSSPSSSSTSSTDSNADNGSSEVKTTTSGPAITTPRPIIPPAKTTTAAASAKPPTPALTTKTTTLKTTTNSAITTKAANPATTTRTTKTATPKTTTNSAITTKATNPATTTRTTKTATPKMTTNSAITTKATNPATTTRTTKTATPKTTTNSAITTKATNPGTTTSKSTTNSAITTKATNTAISTKTTKTAITTNNAPTTVASMSSNTPTMSPTTNSASSKNPANTAITTLTTNTATTTPMTNSAITTNSATPSVPITTSDTATTAMTTMTSNTATTGKHLQCTEDNEVKSIFLPLGDSESNYNVVIKATAKNVSFVASTTIKTQVVDYTAPSGSSGDALSATVENVVAQLKKQGLLSGETVGQIFDSVSNKLNSQSDELKKAERQKLREQMLAIMTDTVKEAPSNNPQEVQVMARGLTALSKNGTELSSSAQEEASQLFAHLSSSLLHMDMSKTEENKEEIHTAASTIVEGAGNILHFSINKNTSDTLLVTLDNTLSALLALKDANEGPTIITQAHISVFANRVTPSSLHTETMNIPNCSCTSFSLPVLPSDIFPSDEPVDVRMLSLDKNPFSWNEKGNISGLIGSLSLTTIDGSKIPVEDLSDNVEIFLPRPVGEQVNTSVLDLGNYSTTVIDVPSADTTLVLKMVPSKDPLPFKVFLGYMDYPTDTNHVAMTEMPHQGTTKEERYTWLLDPDTLKGNTGVHYLVVRPIVGPGIKSINATLSITSITSECKFWDESKLDWSNYGCKVGVQTTHLVTQCLCNHLSFFGSSFFVTPNLVDPSRTAELFATFAENPVVVCFIGALFVVYFLAVIWARRKDIQDTAKVKVTVLEDNDPLDEYRYLLSVCTGHRRGASTSSQVAITLMGAEGNSEPYHLTDPKKCVFERGAVDMFLLTTPFSLGDLQGIRLWHNNSGSHPDWYVCNVMVQDLQTEQKWHFLCNSWLAIDMGDCSLDKVFPVSTEMELKRFSNLFFMKTTKDFSDGHLWYSVISRPPSSTFTCVQRVSCCFSLLLCTMLTSVMFYGIPTDPSEQTMDLGQFEFTWQQFMIGVQSSLIMFPVNILIVTIFRITHPRKTSCCKRKAVKPVEQLSFSQDANTNMNVTLDTVIKDITRIALSLSKTAKSNIPCKESEFGPGEVDINAVLSVVDDFIKQNNKTSDIPQSKTQSSHNLIQPQQTEGSASLHRGPSEKGIQKKSNKTQYLYRQLCHIDKALTLLGPSGFPNPHSYSQALQQVQGMKASLEDQLLESSCYTRQMSPPDSTDDDDSKKKKRVCCHGGLPWWFIFVGWLLVIATSVVAGYFTMLYGLKFGKERSVSWLVSMIVSFFQSILVIQPLKVICIAVFFALVIKKVDEDDFQNLAFEGNDKNLGDCKDQQAVRRDGGLYAPPPPADIEKMKRNKIMEQKAFALIKEILTYMGFMWMLLLVAYGQRDANAFFLNRHIRHSFSKGISTSMSLGEVFAWANTSLLNNLFGVYPGFITDGNSKLVGNARLRQLRVQTNSCQIADSMQRLVSDCLAPYSWEVEDMGSYDPGWNHSAGDNISDSISSPWKYQTQAQLRAYPFWGKMVLYRGGGFVAELGPDLQNASSTLEYLFRNKWLDMFTRVIFVEFTVYNANVNLFCIVTLLFETTAIGAFQFYSELQSVRLYQSTGSLHIFVMAAEIIYLLFILYYMFLQGKLIKQQRWTYFRSKWNIVELTIILLSWSAVAIFIKRTLLGNRDMTYYQNHKDQFASFYETATADSVLQYLIAFLVLLSTIKLWHLLRLNPKMNLISATLERAWGDILGFLVVIMVMFLAYSIASNVIYGWKLSHYRTLMDALIRIISLQIGIFNYKEVLNSSPWLGGLLFGSCTVLLSYMVLNLLVSVILVAFHQEQIYHKPSDEEEIVDLMLKKICSLFGIKLKNTNNTTGPGVNGDMDLTLNNSRNILNNSATDVNIFQTPDQSVTPRDT
uniref:polycystin-1-like protein 2 n=1 Tax=Semicossyphus pulcher TaxID=241346 RepID=UPI0037E779AE